MQVKGFPEFTIPSHLSVSPSATAITHPKQLSQLDWMAIAQNRRITYAYTMGTAPKDGDPPQAEWAALDWMIPDGTNYLEDEDTDAYVRSEVTCSEGTASYVRAGVDKQQASVGFPFASASFEREHKERHASSSYKKQLQLIGRWYYPRATLILKFCTAASDRFKDAVEGALNDYDKSSQRQGSPLLEVFRKYGTAVPKKVTLGGQMTMIHKEDYQGSVKEDEVKTVISAAVSIKSKGGTAQGTASASFQNGTGSTVTADHMSKSIQFTVKGGDATKASNPSDWPDTVKPASRWAVIGREGMTPIIDFLPDDLRKRAMAVWPKLPVPPAIWELQETLARDHVGTAKQAQFVLRGRLDRLERTGRSPRHRGTRLRRRRDARVRSRGRGGQSELPSPQQRRCLHQYFERLSSRSRRTPLRRQNVGHLGPQRQSARPVRHSRNELDARHMAGRRG